MTVRDRFASTLKFEQPKDRIPMIEWAAWWDKTLERWFTEGLPQMNGVEAQKHFGLDVMQTIAIPLMSEKMPKPCAYGAGLARNQSEYRQIRKYLFQEELLEGMTLKASKLKDQHGMGEIIIRLWLDGFFWFPRTIMGIENHLFAFYDNPELMHQMNEELSDFLIKGIDAVCSILIPDMTGFAEDMSYNKGPMLSRELYNTFILPYYRKVIPHLKKRGIPVLIDSDGDITEMIPWMVDAGIEGVYPLERQAGVDICRIRQRYPGFLMLGGYDKMVMPLGEKAMRAEFERILPVMRSGGYIPSVDHQTPPGVSLENYLSYIQLFKEYTVKATR